MCVVLRRKQYQSKGKKMINHATKGKMQGNIKINAKLIGLYLKYNKE